MNPYPMYCHAGPLSDLLSAVPLEGKLRARPTRPGRHWPALVLLMLAACTSTPAPVDRAETAWAGAARLAAGPAPAHAAPVPADTIRGTLAVILADMRHRSFALTPTKAAGLSADNYRQRLGATLNADSYTVAARTTNGRAPAWQVRWTLRGIGREGALTLRPTADTAARPTVADGHATYQQPGFAVDYDNTEDGVRQTFRLAGRPAGTGPVQVQLAVATALHAHPAGDSAVVFRAGDSEAPVLRYAGLRAWDATGRVLPAHLRLGNGGTALALEVDDAGARYPLTIDPLASTAGTTLTGLNAGDDFATSVAAVGDLDGDGYGDLAVGAPSVSGGAGVVRLYRGSSTGVQPTGGSVINGNAGLEFGASVAGAGDFNGDGYADLLIGAPGFANGGTLTGVAYLYAGGANFFTNTSPSVRGIGGLPYSRGGTAVAGVGDLNGDGYDDFASGGPAYNTNSGAVTVVFGNAGFSVGPGSNMSTFGQSGYELGRSLTGLGDTNGDGYADLAAGAPGVNSALVVTGSTATSISNANAFYLTPSTGSTAGTSVAGPGDMNGDGLADVLLGAPGANAPGSVYLFLGSTTLSGTSNEAAVFSTAEPDERFGTTVTGVGDLNGDGYGDLLGGAPAYNARRGRAYAYYGSPAALAAAPSTSLLNPNTATNNDFLGASVASAGDVNGDGYADAIVGAYRAGPTNNGRAYVYLGSAIGLPATPTLTLNAPNTNANGGDNFGASVASAGDVNGDGYADVIVGAYQASTTSNAAPTGNGRAYLYLGSASGLATMPTLTLNDPNTTATNDNFGYSVASAGDVNGDGYADVLIGAYQASRVTNTAATGNGRAYLYMGSSTGLPATPTTTFIDPNTSTTTDYFGASVASAGDVNGDGYADIVVGAYQAATTTNATATNNGRAYLYLGSVGGVPTTPSVILNDPNTTATADNFGRSVASAGDVNGDGYADIVVGANQASLVNNTIFTGNGRAYLYLGRASGLPTAPSTTLNDPNTNFSNDYFGYSVASAGDVNGDGYADVVVGASQASTVSNAGNTGNGRTYLYLGSAGGLPTTPGTTLNNPNTTITGDLFGYSVAGAGDVNGDGYADVLAGAIYASTTTNANAAGNGRAYLYMGNQGGRAGGLRVYNTNLTSPISASNRASSQFGIGLTARNPAGRIRARLVWEVVKQGTPFSGSPAVTNSTAYTGLGAWTGLPAGGPAPELKTLVTKAGRTSRVRARLEYASSPLPATPPANGVGTSPSRARYGPWTYVAAQQSQNGSAATALPVELTAFTATAEGSRAVRLAWTTASEKNSKVFEVERSLDGREFARVGEQAAAGSSSSPRSYELLDAQLPAGAALLYYRLRQVDTDGTFSYSPVRTVTFTQLLNYSLTLFPNPTPAGHGAATLTGAIQGAAVTVFDALGRPVFTTTADASGTATLVLPAGLPAGIYLVRAGSRAVRLTVE